MRKIATYLSAIVLLTACITNNRQNNRILYVSIQPLQSLVDSIVGGDFEVEVLVPAGASPETFEPTPRQFVELNEAQLIFNVGLIDFETSLLGKVEQQEKVIDLSHGIDLIEGSCSHSIRTVSIPMSGPPRRRCRRWRQTLSKPFAKPIPIR